MIASKFRLSLLGCVTSTTSKNGPAGDSKLRRASSIMGPEQPRNKEEIRKRIRSGTYYVAAVGFDDKRTRAIAFVEYICGNLCGNSLFYFLRKSDKGWEETPEVQREVQRCGRIY